MTENKKANQSPVTRMEITAPVMINKAFITPEILTEMEFMQSLGKSGWDKPVYDNEGAELFIKSIDEAISLIISEIADSAIGEVKVKETRILCDLNYVREFVRRLSIEKDMVKSFGFKTYT
jgi:hypothetical protein